LFDDYSKSTSGGSEVSELPRCVPPQASAVAPNGAGQLLDQGHAAEAARRLNALKQQINRLQRSVRLAIENELTQWSGKTYGSLRANQDVVRMLHEMVDSHGLRLRCPECGHPAILRCSARPGIEAGVFVFDHQVDGRRTFHGGGVVLPILRLVAKPPRRRKGE